MKQRVRRIEGRTWPVSLGYCNKLFTTDLYCLNPQSGFARDFERHYAVFRVY
jgi:hypothetical protein